MPEAATPPPPEATTRRPRLQPGPNFGEVVVEVDNPEGRHVLWFPTQERLRPRWDWTKLPRGSTSEAGLAKMPALPGMHIVVTAKERRARVIDPLGDKRNERLLIDASAVYKAIFGQAITAVPPVEKRGLTDDEIATWLYWLWREVEAGHFRVVQGPVPTLEDLADKLPQARIRRKFFDSLAYKRAEGETEVGKVMEEYTGSYAVVRPDGGG